MASTTRQHPENGDTDNVDVTDETTETGPDAEVTDEVTKDDEVAEDSKEAAKPANDKPDKPGSAKAKGKPRPGKGPKGRSPHKTKALKAASRGVKGMSTSSIVMFTAVGVLALAIVGFTGWKVWDETRPFGQQEAQQIDGVVNYREKDPDMLTRQHVTKPVKYKLSPPVGGNHNPAWENCEGDVYGQQVPNPHAVHSMEHGAVWVTYNPDELSAAEIETLAKKVRGKDFMLMSPYPGLKSKVSLQAWGFRLQLDSVNDPRIDKFIVEFRKKAGVERGAGCSGGVTITGKDALTAEQLQQLQAQQNQQMGA